MPLTEDQRKKIAAKLFLFNASVPVLPVPANTDNGTVAGQLATRMKPVAATPRFEDISFGVIDFTADRMNPKVFMHKGHVPWRMGSTGKIAVLLAAAQLRDDIQKAKDVLDAEKVTLTPKEFDQLFATIWSRHKDQSVRDIGGPDGAPRVSTIFDLSLPEPDFKGADDIIDKTLERVDYVEPPKDPWSEIPKIDFQDRLWLMGAQSDNTSAQSCISEIGVAYIKEVQRAYGLFNPTKGMHMLLSGGYFYDSPKTPVSLGSAQTYRVLRGRDAEKQYVVDKYFDSSTPQRSTQPGSVAALTAYMIALIQDKLVSAAGCVEIRRFLADGRRLTSGSDPTLPGSLFDGVKGIQGVTIGPDSFGKGGALEKAKTKAERALRCDLAYIETVGSAGKKFAIVAQGLVPFPKDGPPQFEPDKQGEDLAKAIHAALIAP